MARASGSPREEEVAHASQVNELEDRRKTNTQVKYFDPTTERFTFISFAKRLQQQLHQSVSPLHSTHVLDLLEQQLLLLQSVGCAGIRRRGALARDSCLEKERRNADELQFSSFGLLVRQFGITRQAAHLGDLLAQLGPLSASLPLLIFHRQRVVQILLRYLLVDEATTTVLTLLQALAKDLRGEFVPFLPSVFSSLLLLLQQLQTTADADTINLLFICIGNLFRYLSRPLLRDFNFCLALFTPWLCGDSHQEDGAPLAQASCGHPPSTEDEGTFGTASSSCPSPHMPAPSGGQPRGDSKDRDVSTTSADRKGYTRQKGLRGRRRMPPQMRLLAARAFACLLRKSGNAEEGNDFLGCVDALLRQMARLSPSSRSAYSESVARVLFEGIKNVQGGYTTSFERLVRFLFAVVLFQKPYVDPRTGVTYSPTLEAVDRPEYKRTQNAPTGSLSAEQGSDRGKAGGIVDNCDSAAAVQATCEPATGLGEPSGDTGQEKCEGTFQDLERETTYFPLYRQQTQCAVQFILYVRQHAGSVDSPGAAQAQNLLLEFLRAAVRVTPALLVSAAAKVARREVAGGSAQTSLHSSAGSLRDLEKAKRQLTLARSLGEDEDSVIASREEQGPTGSVRAPGVTSDPAGRNQNSGQGVSCQETDQQQTQDESSGPECEVCGAPLVYSPAFGTFSKFPFDPFFRDCPAPQHFGSHPFFAEVEGGRCKGLEGAFLSSSRASGVFCAFGFLTLLELAGAWVTTVPRLKGSFNLYVEQLLRCFGPSDPGPVVQRISMQISAEKDLGSSGSATWVAPILRPLLYVVKQQCILEETAPEEGATVHTGSELEGCSAGGYSINGAPFNERWSDSLPQSLSRRRAVTTPSQSPVAFCPYGSSSLVSSPPADLELISAVSLLLPCAFLRLLATVWRAVPNSFCSALDSAAFPNIFQQVFLLPLKSVRKKQGGLHQRRTAECTTVCVSSLCCWRRSLLEAYVDCCVTCIATLHAHSLPLQPGQVQEVSLRFVEGFDVYALRSVSEFLLESLLFFSPSSLSRAALAAGHKVTLQASRGLPPGNAQDHAEGDDLSKATSRSIQYVHAGLGSLWKGSAAGVLLSQELAEFAKIPDSIPRGLMFVGETTHAGSSTILLLQQQEKFSDLLFSLASRIARTTECISSGGVYADTAAVSLALGDLRRRGSLARCATEGVCVSRSSLAGTQETVCSSSDGIFCLTVLQTEELVSLYGVLVWLRAATETGTEKSTYRSQLTQVLNKVRNFWTESPDLDESVGVLQQKLAGLLIALVSWLARGFLGISRQTAHAGLLTAGQRRWEDSAGPQNVAAFDAVPSCEAGCRWGACERLAAVLHVLQISSHCLANISASFYLRTSGPSPVPPVHLVQLVLSLPMEKQKAAGWGPCYHLLSELAEEGPGEPTNTLHLEAERLVPSFLGSSASSSPLPSVFLQSHSLAAWGELFLRLFCAGTSIWRHQTVAPVTSASSGFLEAEVLLSPLLRCAANCVDSVAGLGRRPANLNAKTEGLGELRRERRPSEGELSLLSQSPHLGLQTAIRSSMSFVLPCLSSPSRQARLHALELLWLSTDALFAGVPIPLVSEVQNQLSWLIDLETVPVGLETERRITALYDRVAKGAHELLQAAVPRSTSLTGSRNEKGLTETQKLSADSAGQQLPLSGTALMCTDYSPDFTRAASSHGESPHSSVLPVVECTIRVLIGQLSVKFSPLWEPAVHAILYILEAAGKVTMDTNFIGSATDLTSSGKRKYQVGQKRGYGAVQEEQGPLRGTEKRDEQRDFTSALGQSKVSAPALHSVWQARQGAAVLQVTWRIVTGQVDRAVRDLLSQARQRNCSEHTERGASTAGGQDASARRLEATGTTSTASAAGVPGSFSRQAPASTAMETDEGGGSTSSSASRNTVWLEWRRQLSAVSGDETDPMSRHTSLLHIVEGIVRRFGSDAFEKEIELASCYDGSTSKDVAARGAAGHGLRAQHSGTLSRGDGEVASVTRDASQRPQLQMRNDESVAHALASPRTQTSASRQNEGIARLAWLLRECVRVVDTLTNGSEELLLGGHQGKAEGVEKTSGHCPEPGEDDARNCSVDAPELNSRVVTENGGLSSAGDSSPGADKGRHLSKGLRTHHVSLVPRACDLLRAVTAFGTLDTRQLALTCASPSMSLQSGHEGTAHPEEGGKIVYVSDAAKEADYLWQQLLSSCAQRLITVADSTLQQLVIKVLQLSPALRPQLRPYEALLQQLITEKGNSDALLRLRLGDGDSLEETSLPTAGSRSSFCHVDGGGSNASGCDEGGQGAALSGVGLPRRHDAGFVVLQPQHRRFILPLFVRLLITKAQHRARGRSASTTFAQRRSIFSFLSTLASKELPLLLAVLLHPLVDVTMDATKLCQDPLPVPSHSVGMEVGELNNGVSRADEFSTAFGGALRLVNACGVGTLYGFEKEAYLRDFIAAKLEEATVLAARDWEARPASENGVPATAQTERAGKEGRRPKCAGATDNPHGNEKPSSTPWGADSASERGAQNTEEGDAATVVIGRCSVVSGSSRGVRRVITVSLADSCLSARSFVRLHGCLKTLQQLQLLLRRVLLPAAPFLLLLYRTVLLRLVRGAPSPTLSSQVGSTPPAADGLEPPEIEAPEFSGLAVTDGCSHPVGSARRILGPGCTVDEDGAEFVLHSASGDDTAIVAGTRSTSSHPVRPRDRHQKQTLQLTLLLLRNLLEMFPDFAAAWELLLRPAGAALQRLLEAAVATAAAAPVCPRKDGTQKKNIPAVIALVCSWAAQPAFFPFFSSVLPKSLSTIFAAPASAAVLARVSAPSAAVGGGKSRGPLRNKWGGSACSSGVLDAVIHAALLLSCGGVTEQQQKEYASVHQSQLRSLVADQKTRRRNRRGKGRGFDSSSSSLSSDGEAEESDADDAFQKQRLVIREEQKATDQQLKKWEQLGMEILRPHLPVLLKALEILFQHRRKAELAGIAGAELRNSNVTGGVFVEDETKTPGEGEELQEEETAFSGRGLLGVVRLKELQLLTRIAHCASDGHRADVSGNVQAEADPNLSSAVVVGFPVAGRGGEGKQREDFCIAASSIECRLILLLLQSLPIGPAQARRVNNRTDSETVCRLRLTLQTLRRLTVPIAAQVRTIRAAQLHGTSELSKGGELPCFTASSDVLSELARVLRLVVSTCSSLLQHINVLSCRAAAAELLVAAEFAACGLPHSEETFAHIRKTAATLVAGEAAVVSDGGAVVDEEATLEARGERLLRILTPGGSLFSSVIEKATEMPTSVFGTACAEGPDSRNSGNQCCLSLLPSLFVTPADTMCLALEESHAGEYSRCQCAGISGDSRCSPLARAGAVSRASVSGITESQWRATAALTVLLLNTLRHQTALSGSRAGILSGDDEEQPDTDMQLFVLSALVARPSGQPPCARPSEPTLLEAWLSVSALEPVMCQCLFLLGTASVEWPVQQAGLGVLKCAVDICCTVVIQDTPPDEGLGFGRSILRVLGRMVMPFSRSQLKRPEEAQNRIGLQILDYVVRRFSGLTCSFPSLSVATDAQAAQRHYRQLEQVFHVDLAVLVPGIASPAPGACADIRSASESPAFPARAETGDSAGRVLRTQAQNEGGDFFHDLLHMQRHRRGRALQRLAYAVSQGSVGATTIRLVCVPICISCLLQRSSCASYLAGNRKGNLRREVFHQGLANQAIACLETCCRRVRWIVSLRTVQLLCGFLGKYPEREVFLFKAVCAVVRAFEAQARAAANQALNSDDATLEFEDRDGLGRAEVSDQEDGNCSEKHVFALDEEANEGGEMAAEDGKGEQTQQAFRARRRIELMQASIRSKLVPLLFRLAFNGQSSGKKCQTKADNVYKSRSGGSVSDMTAAEEKKSARREGDTRPAIVAALLLVLRLLPAAEFDLQLPKLVRAVAFNLRSREREVRRKARAALVALAGSLGPSCFAFLVSETSLLLQQRQSKAQQQGNDRASNAAMGTSAQAFYRPVLLFTLHAMLSRLVQHPSPHGGVGAASQRLEAKEDDEYCEMREESVKPEGGAPGVLPGELDEAVPLLLPLIAEELNRVSDPDRPFEDRSSTRQHSKIDEARHLKGPSMMSLLGSIVSSSSCLSCIIPFLYSLLGGVGSSLNPLVAIRQGYCVSASFSPAYFERVKELFLYFSKGVSRNPGLDARFHVLLSRRFLTAAVAALQVQLLHPLQLQRAGRSKEALELSLIEQQLRFQSTLPRIKYSGKTSRKRKDHCVAHLPGGSASGAPAVQSGGRLAVVGSCGGQGSQSEATELRRESPTARRARLFRDDMAFFRSLLSVSGVCIQKGGGTSRNGAPVLGGSKASSTDDSDEDGSALHRGGQDDDSVEWQVPRSVPEALETADRFRIEALRAAAATRKHRTMVTQPGAATGCSLDQALTKRAVSRSTVGFDSSARAAALGYLGLRLLQFALRKHKAESKLQSTFEDCTATEGLQRQRRRSNLPVINPQVFLSGRAQRKVVTPVPLSSPGTIDAKRKESRKEEEHQWLVDDLERTVPNLLVCFGSSNNELVSWAARCLLLLIPLQLSELDRRGAIIAFVALRVFQSAGTGNSITQQQLLPSCTRLLAMVLLRPQASTWMDTALHGRVPFSHRELLLQHFIEQAESQRKTEFSLSSVRSEPEARQVPAAPRSAVAEETSAAASLGAVHEEVERYQVNSETVVTTAGAPGGNSLADNGDSCGGQLVLSEAQLQILKTHELAFESKTPANETRRENFKEALLAQVLHALEDHRLRLCGLMLFKGVVLPHYREAAAAAVIGQPKKSSQQNGVKKKKEKGSLADCSLLHEVYKGVNTIARLMIQEAGEDNESRRLAAVCADVYVHFLLNFPMTEKIQQRRVLFLLRNMEYPTAEGRRAVLNCVHKVLVRFPSKLILERYGEVLLLSLCCRLVLEEDRTAHEMLRMLLVTVIHIAEDAKDSGHSATQFLQTAVRVLLQPTVAKLLALQEFLLIFQDTQAFRLPSLLPRLLPLLVQILTLSCNREGRDNAGGWLCEPTDWRISFKALQIFENILVHVHPSVLDSLLAKAVVTARSSGGSLGTTDSIDGLSAAAFLRECCFSNSDGRELPAMGRSLKSTLSLASRNDQGNMGDCRLSTLEDTGARPSLSDGKQRSKENGEPVAEGGEPAIALVGAALARLWFEAAASGLRHEHPWVRAISLRCVGRYIARKPKSAYRPAVPCLLYLSKRVFFANRPDATPGVTQQTSASEVRPGHETSGKPGGMSAEHNTGIGRTAGPIMREKRNLSPGADLALSALAPFGVDTFLEKNPAATISALGLIVPLLRLSLARPELVYVPPRDSWISATGKEQEDHGSSPDCQVTTADTRKRKRKRLERHFDHFCSLGKYTKSREGRDSKAVGGKADHSAGEDNLDNELGLLEARKEIDAIMESGEGQGNSHLAGGRAVDCGGKRPRVSNPAHGSAHCSERDQEHTGSEGGTKTDDSENTRDEVGDLGVNRRKNAKGSEPQQSSDKTRDSDVTVIPDDNQGDEDSDTDDRTSDEGGPDDGFAQSDVLTLEVLLKNNTTELETETSQRRFSEANDLTRDVLAFEDRAASLASSLTPFTLHGAETVCSRTAVSDSSIADGNRSRLRSEKGADSGNCSQNNLAETGGESGACIGPEDGSDPSLNGCANNGFPGELSGAAYNCEDVNSHPVVFLARRLNFWLRRHLGTLGAKGYRCSPRMPNEADACGVSVTAALCTSVTRAGAILVVLHHLVQLLPLSVPHPREDDGQELSSSCDEAQCKQRHARAEPDAERLLQAVLLFVVEAAYRCSTVLGVRASEDYHGSGRILLELLQSQQSSETAGEAGHVAGAPGDVQQWAQLQQLAPRDQQIEVSLAGTFVLNELQRRMREAGRDAGWLRLLGEVRSKVLSRRSERKAGQHQQAVLQPQRHAEKRRRQQLRKRLSKRRRMAELIAHKRGKGAERKARGRLQKDTLSLV
ncbi:down-regulated in metastasis protein [Cystoisospora suis]|uniref:Down-regulated in metastasis protein n=1 Tax=Cystoisospora suis TaxID=483139 RepID=A0A2C6KPA2_9APIC|nr:down-regulated in metastasis protein [Cystoisospora suis]